MALLLWIVGGLSAAAGITIGIYVGYVWGQRSEDHRWKCVLAGSNLNVAHWKAREDGSVFWEWKQ